MQRFNFFVTKIIICNISRSFSKHRLIVDFFISPIMPHKVRVQNHRAHTTASLLEVVAAVGEFETSVVAVARLIARALDNRVRRLFLYDAAGVPALTAKLRGAAASGGGPINGQGNQRGDDGQSGQRRVLPPHSSRDSATLTTLLRPPPATTTLVGPTSRGNAHTCRCNSRSPLYRNRNSSRVRSVVDISIYALQNIVFSFRRRMSFQF